MAETAPKPEKGLLERIKGWKGWILAGAVVVAPAVAVLEGVHIGTINSYEDWRAKGKKTK